jgi:hypothetical protein
MATASSDAREKRRRRTRWRLRILLAVTGLLLLGFLFSQLEPWLVRRMGWPAESLYDLLNAPVDRELTLVGQALVDEVKSHGGYALVTERTPGLIGNIGRQERFSISFSAPSFGQEVDFNDADLAHLVRRYGDLIWGIHLGNTKVSDEGLHFLKEIPHLRHLGLGEEGPWDFSGKPLPETSRITDHGLAHLRDLKQLQSLHIRGLLVTDAGLDSLSGLSNLHNLVLSRTRVQGSGLASLKSLPKLGYLSLDGSTVTPQGLSHLSGLPQLGLLSLNAIPLSDGELIILKTLTSLNYLEIRGCGLSDDQVKDLKKSNPRLKIER